MYFFFFCVPFLCFCLRLIVSVLFLLINSKSAFYAVTSSMVQLHSFFLLSIDLKNSFSCHWRSCHILCNISNFLCWNFYVLRGHLENVECWNKWSLEFAGYGRELPGISDTFVSFACDRSRPSSTGKIIGKSNLIVCDITRAHRNVRCISLTVCLLDVTRE